MSRKYKFGDSDSLYFITYGVIYWIDVFIRNEYKDVLIDSWKFCQANKGLEIYGWIIMPSHVHMIISSHSHKLQDTIGQMKSHTSRTLKEIISSSSFESRKEWMIPMMRQAGMTRSNNKDWQFWQQHNQPLVISNADEFYKTLEYLHSNPVAAGFVRKQEDWLYSSAGDFYGRKGMIELSHIS